MGIPTQLGVDTDWVKLDAHWSRTCATKLDGSIYCWGDDTSYMGDIIPGEFKVPVPTRLTDGPFDRYVLGGHASCGRRLDGRWSCFGANTWGQLGIGTTGFVHGFVDVCPL